ncbi:Thioredoxin-like [Parapedobacter luteus]|uniref:Thioredoxin-like n=1 Tax=Parapedobacter luteus TaxID=623280 RepID=A0A1T4ZUV5_9SPHI|nr:thioredoxin-like domain-containing protein [Parapedobacter luteus]SKB26532.1 Thioredoxin-like [Parapedobacter luteus]
MKKVKAKYAEQDDVVFVYITDESSNYEKWNEYVSLLGDEHYYLYDSQRFALGDLYGFKNIPAYLIFDKKGELSKMYVGVDITEAKAITWIENARAMEYQ